MVKLASILAEVSALESSLEKVASSKNSGSSIASFLDKIAEEAACESDSEESKKKEEEDKKKAEEEAKKNEEYKEGSMKLSDTDIRKIAAALKVAVLDNEQTQGSLVDGGAASVDGAATNAARETDQVIPLATVESAAESNPQKHNTSTTSDLIEGETPNVADMAQALKEGKLVLYTAKEAAVLEKFASVGYNYVVDTYSDQIVQEKVAAALVAEQAKGAPQKIARAILANKSVKTASANPTVQKLAQIKKNDPKLFDAIKTLAERKLI